MSCLWIDLLNIFCHAVQVGLQAESEIVCREGLCPETYPLETPREGRGTKIKGDLLTSRPGLCGLLNFDPMPSRRIASKQQA